MASYKLQQWLLRAGLVMSALLLIRFAIDFSEEMAWWLSLPFCALVIAALGVSAVNVFGAPKTETVKYQRRRGDSKRTLLLAAIPLGLLASSLDCTGLSLQGCSRFCTFIKLAWIPLIAVFCAIYFQSGHNGWLTAIAGMSFIPLAPHCVCYNVGNAWWIDRIGESPLCYGWGFAVTIIAIGALTRGSNGWISPAVCFTIISAAVVFFASHHYFQFPW